MNTDGPARTRPDRDSPDRTLHRRKVAPMATTLSPEGGAPVAPDQTPPGSTPQVSKQDLRRAAWASSLGSAMEYYDFAL